MRIRLIAILISFLLLPSASSALAEETSCTGFGVTLVRLLSAGLTETVSLEFEPYTATAVVNEESTRAGVILLDQGQVAGVLVADSTTDNDGFLQYVSTQIIAEEENLIRSAYAVWVDEHIRRLQDGLIFAETWGEYYCCILMDGNDRVCLIADVDYAGTLIKALLSAEYKTAPEKMHVDW